MADVVVEASQKIGVVFSSFGPSESPLARRLSAEVSPGGAPSSPGDAPDDEGKSGGDDDDEEKPGRSFQLLSAAMKEGIPEKMAMLYTVAYWVLWRTVESIGDQLTLFGDARNQPLLVRDNKLGSLVDNQFCSTEYDPRWAGDNWQLVVVCNDGAYSKFYVGYTSDDESGQPEPCRALEPMPGRPVSDVKTEMGVDAQFRKLNTAGRGAGYIAQAWIWPRDLTNEEVRELWMVTKHRYPKAQRGLPSEGLGKIIYRAPPNPFASAAGSNGLFPSPDFEGVKGSPRGHGGGGGGGSPGGGGGGGSPGDGGGGGGPNRPPRKLPVIATPATMRQGGAPPIAAFQPPPPTASIIEKDVQDMLEVPLVNRLAFQRLLNVFDVLVDFANYSGSYIVIDRLQNMSCTAELMLEVALRKNPTTAPMVLVLDCKSRLRKVGVLPLVPPARAGHSNTYLLLCILLCTRTHLLLHRILLCSRISDALTLSHPRHTHGTLLRLCRRT